MMTTQYAVLHLQKGSGNDSGMACHIERKDDKGHRYIPENADLNKTHLNRELICFPDGVSCRTDAINKRIENAEVARKISKAQTRVIRVLLTGTHEQMMKIEKEGKLNDWIESNLNWLKNTFGEDNVVSCVLHMDEKTPHLHASVVPIVTGERNRREREGNKKYETHNGVRLAATEIMSRGNLRNFQNSYAEATKPFGLERGIVGSSANHKDKVQYIRDLSIQEAQLHEDIEALQQEVEKAYEGRSSILSLFGKGDLAKANRSLKEKDDEIIKLKDEILKLNNILKTVKEKKGEELRNLHESYKREIDAAIKRAQIAEQKSANQEKMIEDKDERIKALNRLAYPERYSLSSGAKLIHFSIPNTLDPWLFIHTKVGDIIFETSTKIETWKQYWEDYRNGFLSPEEMVNKLFEPWEQVNESQAKLLGAAFELACGGPGQTHIGTGAGGSNDQSPWGGEEGERHVLMFDKFNSIK